MKTLTLKDRLKPEYVAMLCALKLDYPTAYDRLNKVLETECYWSNINVGDAMDLQLFFNLNKDRITSIIDLFIDNPF